MIEVSEMENGKSLPENCVDYTVRIVLNIELRCH